MNLELNTFEVREIIFALRLLDYRMRKDEMQDDEDLNERNVLIEKFAAAHEAGKAEVKELITDPVLYEAFVEGESEFHYGVDSYLESIRRRDNIESKHIANLKAIIAKRKTATVV